MKRMAPPPVNAIPASTDNSAAGQLASPISWADSSAKAATPPIPAPTSGNAQAESASRQTPAARGSTGSRVKKAVAARKPAKKPAGLREEPSE